MQIGKAYSAAGQASRDAGSPEVVEAPLLQLLLRYYRMVVGRKDGRGGLSVSPAIVHCCLDQGCIRGLPRLVGLMRDLRHGGMARESRCHSLDIDLQIAPRLSLARTTFRSSVVSPGFPPNHGQRVDI